MILLSIITCPNCGTAKADTTPTDACQFSYDCNGYGARLKPKAGDSCVFWSYGDAPCPPIPGPCTSGARTSCCAG
jgi:hypothetical protein